MLRYAGDEEQEARGVLSLETGTYTVSRADISFNDGRLRTRLMVRCDGVAEAWVFSCEKPAEEELLVWERKLQRCARV